MAVVNPPQPALPCGTSVEANRIEAICEAASALPCYVTETDEATEAIGQLVAGLLGDGVTLRTGLGKVPSGIPRVLRKPRRLRIHSGLISDGLMELAMSGALDEDCLYRTTIVAGSDASYAWLPQARGVGMLSTLENPGGVNLDTPCG